MEKTVILDLQQIRLFLLLRVWDVTGPQYRKQVWMRYNQSEPQTMRNHHHLTGTPGKEDDAATSKGCLMCAQETVHSPRLEPKHRFHVVTRTYCVHQSLRAHSVEGN